MGSKVPICLACGSKEVGYVLDSTFSAQAREDLLEKVAEEARGRRTPRRLVQPTHSPSAKLFLENGRERAVRCLLCKANTFGNHWYVLVLFVSSF